MADKQFPVSIVISAVDQVTAKIQAINDKIQDSVSPLQDVSNSFRNLFEAMGAEELETALGHVGKKAGVVVSDFRKAAGRLGVIGAAAGGALFSILKGTSENAEAIWNAAERVGISTDKFQHLQLAAARAGLKVDELEPILTRFSKNIGDAGVEAGEARDLFAAFGISTADLKKLPFDQIFQKVGDGLNKVKDPALRNAAAMQLFGKAGAKVFSIFSEMKHLPNISALILSPEQIERAAEFDDKWDELLFVFSRIRDFIGIELIPVFQELMDSTIKGFIENKAQIVEFARAFAKDLPGILSVVANLFRALWAAVQPVIAVFNALSSVFGSTNVVLAGLALWIGGKLPFSIAALSSSLIKLGIVLLTTPIGWITLAIAALVAAIAGLILYREPIINFFKGIWDWVKSVASAILELINPFNKIMGLASGLKDKFAGFFGGGAMKAEISGPDLGAQQIREGAVGQQVNRTENQITVAFENMPRGTRVRTDKAEAPLDLNLGLGMASP